MQRFVSGLSLLFLLFLNVPLSAQVGIGILTPDSTAILHLHSTDRGFLLPRMTLNDRNAITVPATGLMIYNLTDSVPQYWNGTCWLSVYQENCTDCYFTMNLSQIADTIDRVIGDSSVVQVNVIQTSGTTQQVAFWVMGLLPPGLTYTISPNPIMSTGSTTVTFHADPFVPAGVYPVVIQALCGPSVHNIFTRLRLNPATF